MSIYLNGRYLASGRDCFKSEISSLVRKGANTLVVLLESLGHHCGGEKSFNGINCPVYLSSQENYSELKEWRRKLVSKTYPEKSLIKEELPEIAPEFDDSGWEKVKVDKGWDSRLCKNQYEECFLWYRAEVKLPSNFKGRALSLDFGPGMNKMVEKNLQNPAL